MKRIEKLMKWLGTSTESFHTREEVLEFYFYFKGRLGLRRVLPLSEIWKQERNGKVKVFHSATF